MSEVVNIAQFRPRQYISTELADQLILGQLFANLAQLNLICQYLAETDRCGEAGMIHALTMEIHQIADHVRRRTDAKKAK